MSDYTCKHGAMAMGRYCPKCEEEKVAERMFKNPTDPTAQAEVARLTEENRRFREEMPDELAMCVEAGKKDFARIAELTGLLRDAHKSIGELLEWSRSDSLHMCPDDTDCEMCDMIQRSRNVYFNIDAAIGKVAEK